MNLSFTFRRLPIIVAIFLVIFLAIGYDYIVRVYSIPDKMSYVPKDSSLVLYTDSVKFLWNTLDSHLRRFFIDKKEGEEISEFSQFLINIRETFNELGVPIDSLDSLGEYGINTEEGLVFAVDGNIDKGKFLIVVPVNHPDRFTEFLSKITEKEAEPDKELVLNGRQYTVRRYPLDPGLFFVSPKRGLVLLSTHRGTLRKSLAQPISNLSYHRDNDVLLTGLRSISYRFPDSAAKIHIFWRPTHVLWLRDLTAGLYATPERISIRMRAVVDTGTSRLLRDLASLSTEKSPIVRSLHENTGIVFSLKDPSLSYYLKFLRKYGDPDTKQEMEEFFGGLLVEVEEIDSATELTLAVMGYREGLPEVFVGIEGDGKELEQLVFEIQRKKRVERDKEIIERAIQRLPTVDGGAPQKPLIEILDRGLLKIEKDPLWNRYVIRNGEVVQDHLERSDFLESSTYLYETEDFFCHYLLPPITENDLEYRFESEKEELDQKTLMSDRYRLCSTFRDGVLWMATDRETLRGVLSNKGSLKHDVHYSTAEALLGGGRFKIRLYLNMDRIISEGLLSPESTVQDWLKRFLLDMGEYPAIMLDLSPLEGADEIWITGELLRRQALK